MGNYFDNHKWFVDTFNSHKLSKTNNDTFHQQRYNQYTTDDNTGEAVGEPKNYVELFKICNTLLTETDFSKADDMINFEKLFLTNINNIKLNKIEFELLIHNEGHIWFKYFTDNEISYIFEFNYFWLKHSTNVKTFFEIKYNRITESFVINQLLDGNSCSVKYNQFSANVELYLDYEELMYMLIVLSKNNYINKQKQLNMSQSTPESVSSQPTNNTHRYRQLTDKDLIWFGKWKGTALANVPADYLLYLYSNNIAKDALKDYIANNLDAIKQEIENAR